MEAFADWLARTALSHMIIGLPWMVPAVQTVHILALGIALTAAVMMELQLIKAARGRGAPVDPRRRFLPWIVSALVVLTVSGLILVVGEPHRALPNPLFQAKMILLVLVILLLLIRSNVIAGHASRVSRASAFAAGVASLALWAGIVTAGRWIAYVS